MGRQIWPGRPAMTWVELHSVLRTSRALAVEALPSEGLSPRANPTITSVAYDSRIVEPGAVFVALKGLHADGTAFVREALARGAAAIVSEQAPPADVTVLWAVVRDARLALAQIAAAFFRHPSAAMRVVGITGTNGKTTTAFLLASIFEAAGIRCGILGTVAYRIGDELREAT